MPNFQRTRRTLSFYFLCFLFYSCIGWIYEVFLAFLYGYGFVNRGFLYGPFLPIYGFGALVLIFSLRKFMKKKRYLGKLPLTPIYVFLLIILITTTIELASSYLMEYFFQKQLWDYSGYAFNFQARIAPNPSIRFGLGGMLFLYVFQPFFEKIMSRIPQRVTEIAALLLFLIVVTDLFFTLTSG